MFFTNNESFADYFVPLQLTQEQLENKIRTELVDLNYSAGVFVGDRLAGFILHGSNFADKKKVIYNAGTGVVPDHRGQGLTRRMYDFILPVLRRENIDKVVLEVITENLPAIRSYERTGFRPIRRLIGYKGEIKTGPNDAITIGEMQDLEGQSLKTFWDFSPAWQNSASVVEKLESSVSYGAFKGKELVGYLIYNPVSKRIHQFGVNKKYRRQKIASTLFDQIKTPGVSMSVINVEESSSATNEFLKQIGMAKFVEQFEMVLDLGKSGAFRSSE